MLLIICFATSKEQSTSDSAASTAAPAVSETAGEIKSTSAAYTTALVSTAVPTASGKAETTKATSTSETTATTKIQTTSKVQTTAKATTVSKTTTSSAVTCTITVECKKVLEHMDDLKKGHESFVPDNGIILNTYTVTLENGQSAYDALKKACSDNNIKITESSSKYGAYIIGFNNIDEKDCGNGSGWLYFVNGSTPNLSAKKYIVKNNDKIVFSYTV